MNGCSEQVRVSAPPEVDLASATPLIEAVDRAVAARPSEVCLDFGQTTFSATDGVYVLAGAAISCAAVGVSLRVIESPALTHMLELTGMAGEARWRAFACRVVVDRPGRLSRAACHAAVTGLTVNQLVAARSVCWDDYHRVSTAERRVASRHRLRIVQDELYRRTAMAATRHAPPASSEAPKPAEWANPQRHT